MAITDRDWEAKYLQQDTPWDSQIPSQELRSVLAEYDVATGKAIELGCGSGTNAVYLATNNWQVTAVDCSPAALQLAQEKSALAEAEVRWIEADVQHFDLPGETFGFVFDRGCYHCCRRVDLPGYLTSLENLTHLGSHFLCLCGNPSDGTSGGPPRVTEEEIRQEFSGLFELIHLREFHFEDAGGVPGPLGWSVWMQRK